MLVAVTAILQQQQQQWTVAPPTGRGVIQPNVN